MLRTGERGRENRELELGRTRSNAKEAVEWATAGGRHVAEGSSVDAASRGMGAGGSVVPAAIWVSCVARLGLFAVRTGLSAAKRGRGQGGGGEGEPV